MPIEITMPALSPTMEEGTLARWLVKEGDKVSSGDIIAEIETDKATMEVEAVDEGTVGKLVVAEGTEGVKVNAVIAVLLEEGEEAGDIDAKGGDAKGDDAKGSGKGKADEDADEEDGDEDGDEAPKSDKPPARTDDADADAEKKAETPKKGYGRGDAPDKPAPSGDGKGGKDKGAPARTEGERIFASPLARRIARDKGVDLARVSGSGPKGRIVKADIEGFEPSKAAAAPKETAAGAAAGAAPAAATPAGGATPVSAFTTDQVRKMYDGRAYSEVTLDGMRRTIASRLTQAKQTIPHFYLRRDIRLDTLLGLRARLNGELAASGVKLSVNDFVIKASAMALMRVKGANAVWAADRVLQFEAADVAVAVAIEGGLLTPVIRDAHAKGLAAISAEMKDLAARARDRKLQPQEYQGGSFAVSNLGMFGIDNFDAVINPPHASILAVGAGVQKPVVTDGEIGIATIMSVTLSVDHRVVDGALGAQFLDAIRANLENPMMMLV